MPRQQRAKYIPQKSSNNRALRPHGHRLFVNEFKYGQVAPMRSVKLWLSKPSAYYVLRCWYSQYTAMTTCHFRPVESIIYGDYIASAFDDGDILKSVSGMPIGISSN